MEGIETQRIKHWISAIHLEISELLNAVPKAFLFRSISSQIFWFQIKIYLISPDPTPIIIRHMMNTMKDFGKIITHVAMVIDANPV